MNTQSTQIPIKTSIERCVKLQNQPCEEKEWLKAALFDEEKKKKEEDYDGTVDMRYFVFLVDHSVIWTRS